MTSKNTALHAATDELKAAIADHNGQAARSALGRLRALDASVADQFLNRMIAAGLTRARQQ
jgi:hypothetical protein